MCNAWNHSPYCDCGWGGVNYSNGFVYRPSKYARRPYYTVPKIETCRENTYRWSLYYEDYTVKTICPICGDAVFFVRHNGGSVWFDSLGYPWPKHRCFDEKPFVHAAACNPQDIAYQKNINTTVQIYNSLHKYGNRFQNSVIGVVVESKNVKNEHVKISINMVSNQRISWSVKNTASAEELAGSLAIVDSVNGAIYFFINGDLCKADDAVTKSVDTCVSYNVGDQVEHSKYGKGRILEVHKTEGDYKLGIWFPAIFSFKKILASIGKMAKLEK